MRVRFDLYVRYTVEVDIPERLNTLESVVRNTNTQFQYVLREYIPDLEIYGCGSVPGPTAPPVRPIRSDQELQQYIGTAPYGYIFEVRIPPKDAEKVMRYYQTTLSGYLLQIDKLNSQCLELRRQGMGMQTAVTLLQKVAPLQDELVLDVVVKYGQGCDPCITAMVANPEDQWTNQQGLRCLTFWCGDSATNMRSIFQTGGLQPIVTAMQNFPQDAMVQQYAHHIVARFGSVPEYCDELHRLGAVAPIVRNLNYFNSDRQVQQYGCWALGTLAASPIHREETVRHGGISPLINAIANFPQDSSVNRYAISALEPLACNVNYAPQIIQADAVRGIISAMHYHNQDAQVAFHSISTLSELARHESCKPKLRDAGVIPVILNTMKVYVQDPMVQECGLRCLAVLVGGNAGAQSEIFQVQGIPIIVHAVSTEAESKKVDQATTALVAQGLNLLASLAVHAECRPQIVQCKGIDTTLQAMRTFDEAAVQEHGLRVFAGLAGADEAIPYMLQAGASDAIVTSMLHCPDVVAVQMNGCYALGMLASSDEFKLSITRSGSIQVLLAAMYWHPFEPHVHEQGCAALSILSELNQNKTAVGDAVVGEGDARQSGVEVVSSSARNMANQPSAAKQSLKLIAVIGIDDSVKQKLLEANVLNCIFEVLQVHTDGPAVVYYGLKAFVTCTSPDPPPQCENLCFDLIDMVVGTMRSHSADVRMQESGCEVLSIIGRFDALQEPLIQKQAITVICNAIRQFQSDTGVTRKACRAIANMAEHPVSRSPIRQHGVIEVIVNAIKYHAAHPEVGEQGCAAIANLALDEDNRKEVARVGGAEAVLAGLHAHQQHPGIQAYGVGALGNLAVEEDNCRVILAAGAVEMVIYAMQTFPGDGRVQHFACLAFSNFAHDDQNKVAIGRAGGNRMIIAAMKDHVDHGGVQEQACGALANLSIHKQNMLEIGQIYGIEYVVTALKRHCGHPGVQENACFALSKFLTMPNENFRQRMKSAGAEEALNSIKDGNPSFDVRICVNVLLRRMNDETPAQALPENSPAPLAPAPAQSYGAAPRPQGYGSAPPPGYRSGAQPSHPPTQQQIWGCQQAQQQQQWGGQQQQWQQQQWQQFQPQQVQAQSGFSGWFRR